MKITNLIFIFGLILIACEAPSQPAPKKVAEFGGGAQLKKLVNMNRVKLRKSPGSLPTVQLALDSDGTVSNGAAVQCAPVVRGKWQVVDSGLTVAYEIDQSPAGYVNDQVCMEERKALEAYPPEQMRKSFLLTKVSCSGKYDCRGTCETVPTSQCKATILQFKAP